jgi:hypothetical protein
MLIYDAPQCHRIQYLSGDVYEGAFHRGLKCGHGRYVWADGDVYEGNFVQDKREDEKGSLTLTDGTCFEGRFRRDQLVVPNKK